MLSNSIGSLCVSLSSIEFESLHDLTVVKAVPMDLDWNLVHGIDHAFSTTDLICGAVFGSIILAFDLLFLQLH